MNPLTNVKNLNKMNERELELGLAGTKTSWHDKYKDSAWIFIGGLPYDLTEGDVLCIFSQYGEVANINLVRDKQSGKSRGFCFICYEDQRSTILAVDNFNGTKVLGRTLRVDHVEDYRKPKETGEEDDLTKELRAQGCAPTIPKTPEHEQEGDHTEPADKNQKVKKKKHKKEKKKKKKRREMSDSDSESSESSSEEVRVKTETVVKREKGVKVEKRTSGYDKYASYQPSTSQHKSERNGKEVQKKKDRSQKPRYDTSSDSDDSEEDRKPSRKELERIRVKKEKGRHDHYHDSGLSQEQKRSRERTSSKRSYSPDRRRRSRSPDYKRRDR